MEKMYLQSVNMSRAKLTARNSRTETLDKVWDNCVLATLIDYELQDIVTRANGQAFNAADTVKIIELIADTVLYLTTTTGGWWFATRAKRPGET
jgi:hypothetical protein